MLDFVTSAAGQVFLIFIIGAIVFMSYMFYALTTVRRLLQDSPSPSGEQEHVLRNSYAPMSDSCVALELLMAAESLPDYLEVHFSDGSSLFSFVGEVTETYPERAHEAL